VTVKAHNHVARCDSDLSCRTFIIHRVNRRFSIDPNKVQTAQVASIGDRGSLAWSKIDRFVGEIEGCDEP
jgi:hypothetical protein